MTTSAPRNSSQVRGKLHNPDQGNKNLPEEPQRDQRMDRCAIEVTCAQHNNVNTHKVSTTLLICNITSCVDTMGTVILTFDL